MILTFVPQTQSETEKVISLFPSAFTKLEVHDTSAMP